MNSVQMMEEWRDVVGYEGYYKVSDLGRVKSFVGWNGHEYIKREKILVGREQYTRGGIDYKRLVVKLYKPGCKPSNAKVHRLVASSFLKNELGKPNINHKDGNPMNNNIENLEWCTQKENVLHAISTGLRSVPAYENKNAILKAYVAGVPIKELSEKYNSSQSVISKMIALDGVKIRRNEHYKNKYSINKKELAKDFEIGLKNMEIAIKHKTNAALIATYRYKHRKGELL